MPTYSPFSNTKVQIGREASAGTATAATSVWRGPFSMIEDGRERTIVEEQIGNFVSAERSYDSKIAAKWSQPSAPLTYEQVCHILEAGVKTATPSGTGPYTRVYNYPYSGTSVNTIKTYTIEAGSATVSSDVYEAEYAFVEDFEFSGAFGEAWTMQSNWLARQMTQTSFTGSLSAPTVNEALFNYCLLYIDASGGTIGTTQKSGVLTAANIKVKTGLMQVPVGDGQLYATSHKWTQPEITFSITMELEDASIVAAERVIYRANGTRLIRLKTSPSASLQFQIDLAAKYDSISDYENSNGNTTVTFEGHGVASSADSLALTFTMINSVAALGSGGH